MTLPNLRKTVKIRFWSLRNGVGQGLGVIFDIDTKVERDAYRVRTESGWKWQIRGAKREARWDPSVETDQDILDEYGSEAEVEITQAGKGGK